MAKRANGEGTIYHRKDGRWEAAIFLEGRRHRLYGSTRDAVNRQLLAALKSHEDGLLPGGGRETFGHYWEVWLPGMQPHLRARTLQRYEELGRLHLIPSWDKCVCRRSDLNTCVRSTAACWTPGAARPRRTTPTPSSIALSPTPCGGAWSRGTPPDLCLPQEWSAPR